MNLLVACLVVAQSPLMDDAKSDALRWQLPVVEDAALQARLWDPRLVFYTKREMPPAYLISSGNLQGVHAVNYNISADSSEPFGNGNREFPWDVAGGTHRTRGVRTFHFLWLPPGKEVQISRSRGNYSWTFPVGAMLGEVLQLRAPDGEYHTFEMRLRMKEASEWGVDVYRPFPTSHHLSERIKQLHPHWPLNPDTARLVSHLDNPPPMVRHTLSNQHRRTVFKQSAGIDNLPPVGDDALVADLLDTTVFRSCLGEVWRQDDSGLVTFAPTTDAAFHVVPAKYDGGFIEVDRQSCMRCHETVGQPVERFQTRHWYGHIRGSDGIFSFHPYDLDAVSYNGFSRSIRLRQALVDTGIVRQE